MTEPTRPLPRPRRPAARLGVSVPSAAEGFKAQKRWRMALRPTPDSSEPMAMPTAR
jgi:hypothetical protein